MAANQGQRTQSTLLFHLYEEEMNSGFFKAICAKVNHNKLYIHYPKGQWKYKIELIISIYIQVNTV